MELVRGVKYLPTVFWSGQHGNGSGLACIDWNGSGGVFGFCLDSVLHSDAFLIVLAKSMRTRDGENERIVWSDSSAILCLAEESFDSRLELDFSDLWKMTMLRTDGLFPLHDYHSLISIAKLLAITKPGHSFCSSDIEDYNANKIQLSSDERKQIPGNTD
jgi:hypothetical protein